MWSSGSPMNQSHKDKHLWSTWKARDVKYKLERPLNFSAPAARPCSLNIFLSKIPSHHFGWTHVLLWFSYLCSWPFSSIRGCVFTFVKMGLPTLISKRAPGSWAKCLLTGLLIALPAPAPRPLPWVLSTAAGATPPNLTLSVSLLCSISLVALEQIPRPPRLYTDPPFTTSLTPYSISSSFSQPSLVTLPSLRFLNSSRHICFDAFGFSVLYLASSALDVHTTWSLSLST